MIQFQIFLKLKTIGSEIKKENWSLVPWFGHKKIIAILKNARRKNKIVKSFAEKNRLFCQRNVEKARFIKGSHKNMNLVKVLRKKKWEFRQKNLIKNWKFEKKRKRKTAEKMVISSKNVEKRNFNQRMGKNENFVKRVLIKKHKFSILVQSCCLKTRNDSLRIKHTVIVT